jgi:hypothetical protein
MIRQLEDFTFRLRRGKRGQRCGKRVFLKGMRGGGLSVAVLWTIPIGIVLAME